jgi:hypothetical protein
MGGSPIFSILAAAEEFSPEHRAWLAQDALDNALVSSPSKGPDAVSVGRVNGAICVLLGGHKVVCADRASARMEKMSPEQLADALCPYRRILSTIAVFPPQSASEQWAVLAQLNWRLFEEPIA